MEQEYIYQNYLAKYKKYNNLELNIMSVLAFTLTFAIVMCCGLTSTFVFVIIFILVCAYIHGFAYYAWRDKAIKYLCKDLPLTSGQRYEDLIQQIVSVNNEIKRLTNKDFKLNIFDIEIFNNNKNNINNNLEFKKYLDNLEEQVTTHIKYYRVMNDIYILNEDIKTMNKKEFENYKLFSDIGFIYEYENNNYNKINIAEYLIKLEDLEQKVIKYKKSFADYKNEIELHIDFNK